MDSNINELQDVVAKALEAKGVLAKLRAELRKHVFDVMDEQEKNDGAPSTTVSRKVTEVLATEQGKLAAGLVADFLKCCHLDHTLSVFRSEADLKDKKVMSKEDVAVELGYTNTPDEPLLLQAGGSGGVSRETMTKTLSSTQMKSALSSTVKPAPAPTEAKVEKSKPEVKTSKLGGLGGLPSLGKKAGGLGGLPSLGGSSLAPLKSGGSSLAPLKGGLGRKEPETAAEPQKTEDVGSGDYDDFDDGIEDDIEIDDGGEIDYDGDYDADYQGEDPYNEDEIVDNDALDDYDYVETAEIDS